MAFETELRDGIAYMSFNRPEKHNALRDEDLQGLIDALRWLDETDEAQVGILYGRGRSFSSGADVSARLQASMDEGSTDARVNETDAFLECVNWKPVIAAVHGYCLGHAMHTALQCDIVVAGRDTRFQVTEIRIGLPMTSLFDKLGNRAFADEVALTGRTFTAEEARDAGMISRLADIGEHVSQAEAIAKAIMANPSDAVREHVRIRRQVAHEDTQRMMGMSAGFAANWARNAAAASAVASKATELGAR